MAVIGVAALMSAPSAAVHAERWRGRAARTRPRGTTRGNSPHGPPPEAESWRSCGSGRVGAPGLGLQPPGGAVVQRPTWRHRADRDDRALLVRRLDRRARGGRAHLGPDPLRGLPVPPQGRRPTAEAAALQRAAGADVHRRPAGADPGHVLLHGPRPDRAHQGVGQPGQHRGCGRASAGAGRSTTKRVCTTSAPPSRTTRPPSTCRWTSRWCSTWRARTRSTRSGSPRSS